jgi:hypothetical protein
MIMDIKQEHAPRTCGLDMDMKYGHMYSMEMHCGHTVKLRHAARDARTCRDMQHGHEARTRSMHMQHEQYVVWT